jgi:lariat debranching enzyme
MGLLRNLQPTWWFAAHLHTRFEARVRHDPVLETTTTTTSTSSPSSRSGPPPRADNPDEITIDDDAAVEDSRFDSPSGAATVPRVAESIAPPTPQNPDEITLDDEIEAVEPPPPPPRETKFLALDKCLPNRQFLEASPPPSPRSENQSTNLFCPSNNH